MIVAAAGPPPAAGAAGAGATGIVALGLAAVVAVEVVGGMALEGAVEGMVRAFTVAERCGGGRGQGPGGGGESRRPGWIRFGSDPISCRFAAHHRGHSCAISALVACGPR